MLIFNELRLQETTSFLHFFLVGKFFKGSVREKMKGGIGLRRKISAFDRY